jgi:hypothetical protein
MLLLILNATVYLSVKNVWILLDDKEYYLCLLYLSCDEYKIKKLLE